MRRAIRRAPRLLLLTGLLALTGPTLSRPAAAQVRMRPPAPEVTFPEGRDTVDIPFELAGHLITFEGRVGDESLRFILDSGASSAVLRESHWVERLGLEVLGEARVGGAGSGEAATATVAGPIVIQIGDLTMSRDMIVVGVGEDMAGMSWNGALGGGLLSQVVAEIDYGASRLRLHRPESFEMPPGATVLPTRLLSSGVAALQADVTIDGVTATYWLVLDLGAFHNLSLNGGEEGVPLPARRLEHSVTTGWGAQGPLPGEVGVIDALRLGDIELRDVVTTFPGPEGLRGIRRLGADEPRILGNLGSAILRRFTVFIDHPGERLGLLPRATPPPLSNFNTTGIVSEPAANEEGFPVDDVIPGTPAAEDGLKPGELILALDGEPLANRGIELRSRLLDPPPGSELGLTVRRDGGELEVTLVARPLFEVS